MQNGLNFGAHQIQSNFVIITGIAQKGEKIIQKCQINFEWKNKLNMARGETEDCSKAHIPGAHGGPSQKKKKAARHTRKFQK